MTTGPARMRLCALALLLATACIAPSQSRAQAADTRELEAYMGAVTRPQAGERSAALRSFLQSWPQSSLRPDALQWLAWDMCWSDRAVSAGYAREVLRMQPSNP